MVETLADLARGRPTIQPPSVPSLAATLTAMPKSTQARKDLSYDLTPQTLIQQAQTFPLFKRSSLPERAIIAASRGTQSQQWAQAKQVAEKTCQEGAMVLLCGPRWTGKTVMATLIALGYLARHQGAVYTRGVGLLKDLRMDFNTNSPETREMVKPYQRWHLLIVDEVGLRVKGDAGYSDSDHALFTDLIDQRYSNRLATIFISNESPDQTDEKLGPSIVRRIDEAGIRIEATWPSFGDAA